MCLCLWLHNDITASALVQIFILEKVAVCIECKQLCGFMSDTVPNQPTRLLNPQIALLQEQEDPHTCGENETTKTVSDNVNDGASQSQSTQNLQLLQIKTHQNILFVYFMNKAKIQTMNNSMTQTHCSKRLSVLLNILPTTSPGVQAASMFDTRMTGSIVRDITVVHYQT